MGYFNRFFARRGIARFASRLMRAIRAAGETDELRYDAAEYRILQYRDGELVGSINLANMYRTYGRTPRAGRAACLRACVRTAMARHRELPADFDVASHDLRPRIWARASLEQQRLVGLRRDPSAAGFDGPHEPIGEHLLAFLGYDWPESVQSITAENLSGWGVSFYEAMEVARRNLEEATSTYARLGEDLFCFTSGDSYDASRLTLIDRIVELGVAGRPVAMAPTRDQLYITGSDDEVGLAMMAELAARSLDEPYLLSGVPLILEDGAWTDWMPPEDHPSHRAFRRVETNWLGPLYAEQKSLLDAIHQQQGLEVFVATFSAACKADDALVSYCVWGSGLDSLLPVTHKVAFMEIGREGLAALGDWDRVVAVVGHLMEPTEHYPPRYRVTSYPDPAELEAIGKGEL